MDDGFDLDLQTVEEEIDAEEADGEPRVVLGVLDGTDQDRWVACVEAGHVLVLAIEGDLSELAAEMAPRISDLGGNLVHFREFLIVTPPGLDVDTDNL